MPLLCILKKLRASLIVCAGLGLTPLSGVSQSVPSSQGTPSFQSYFDSLATAPGVGGSRGEAGYLKLTDAIPTMTPSEISWGLRIIDRQIDGQATPHDNLAIASAAFMLWVVSTRQDGPDLLADETARLTSMLNDPSYFLSGSALLALSNIARRQPGAVVTIFEGALKEPEVNNSTGVGPGIATTLVRMSPSNEGAVTEVAKYMRRPDLTDKNLIDTIIGITNSPVIPDVLASEFVRCLDRPNDRVKIRALIGISKSSQSARDLARARIQRMSSDPAETEHVKRIAAEALEGRVTEDPEARQ